MANFYKLFEEARKKPDEAEADTATIGEARKKREEEEKVVENEEASKSINKLPKKGES